MSERRYRVAPGGRLRGEIRVPGDKSVSHRAVLLGGIAHGTTKITGFLESADCLATLAAMRLMGVRVERPAHGHVVVHGVGLHGLRAPNAALDMGNAGTALRLSMGLLAGQSFATTLVGDASLTRRPMERAAAPLRRMGARITTTEGHAPIHIAGGSSLQGIAYDLTVPSAQVKSALLLAGLYAEGITAVTEQAVTRDHTERMLKAFGVNVDISASTVALTGGTELHGCALEVPGDISSAAFFITAAALCADGEFLIRDVGINPTRTGVIDILRLMGADIQLLRPRMFGGEPVADVRIRATPLRGIDVPEALVPLAIDEFPMLFIAAAAARGRTVVTNAAELRVKESDRISVMAAGLQAVGIHTEVRPDGIVIEGGEVQGGKIDSHGDHRIAMAFAMASVVARSVIEIADVENVATSFPEFAALARGAGVHIEELGSAQAESH